MSQEPEHRLTDAYRHASESDAGRPAATTRNAILAQAAAAAQRRAPAANESRYWPRMAAGIAVLGVAVLLWRQMDHRMPGDSPVVVQAPATPEVERAPEPARESAPEPATAPAVPSPAPPEPIAVVPQAAPPPVIAPASPPLLAGNQPDEEQELAEVPVTGSRVLTPDRAREELQRARAGAPGGGAAPPRAGQASRSNVDRIALLRQHFPAQYQSDAAHSLWLVQNVAGEVLQSGELASGQLLEELTPQIARALGGRVPGPWQSGTVRNARGRPIVLAIAQLPP